MASPPRKAPREILERIVDALSNPERCILDRNSPSRRYLIHWGLSEAGLYADLRDGLQNHDKLFLKPKSNDHHPQRYQCVLGYAEDVDHPAVDVHVTLSPLGEPPRIMVAVHPSDTARTLPTIPIPTTETDEKD